MTKIDTAAIKAQIAAFEPNPTNGTAVYKFFFANFPSAKKYFKGHETQDPETIPGDPYFQRIGWNFLAKLHDIVDASADEKEFKHVVEEMVISHKNKRGIPVETWEDLHGILGGFLQSLGVDPDPQWKVFCDVFNEHAKAVAKRGWVLEE